MFVGIGDLHLTDSSGRGGLNEYLKGRHDQFVADLVIDQPLKYAKKKGIKDIILYGDICENPRMSYDAQMALARIFDQPFQFHVLLGNHDLFAEDPEVGHSLQLVELFKPKNVTVYTKPKTVDFDGQQVRFLPWPHKKFDLEALNVAHIDVQGSRTDSGRLNDKEDLNTSKATAVIGHIHTRQRVRNSFYSGTLYQTNFGERPEKFFHHITYDDGWVIEDVPVRPVYRLHSVEIESKADLKGIPASEFDLVKLIVKTSKVTAADYQHLNVVKVKAVNSEAELALARVEDLKEGSAVEISTDEFFKHWLSEHPADAALKKQAAKVRREILNRRTK